MCGCCRTANRTSIPQQHQSYRDPNEPRSARPTVRELRSSTDLQACPTWTVARNFTEPMQRHCKLHVGAQHCTAASCSDGSLKGSSREQKWPDLGTNGTPEALDERNQYSRTSRSHWEGSQTLQKAPNPKNCSPGPKNWVRWHGEASK